MPGSLGANPSIPLVSAVRELLGAALQSPEEQVNDLVPYPDYLAIHIWGTALDGDISEQNGSVYEWTLGALTIETVNGIEGMFNAASDT